MKLELENISKAFGDFYANKDISLTVEPGQIHALLGENGAGKSTLMNVLYGLYEPTAGRILVDEVPMHFEGPGDAMAAGIGMVHQHFMLVPVFTVAENVALGAESTSAGLLSLKETRRKIKEISDRYGFGVDPDAIVEDLPVGVQQRVEIIKALVRQAKVLILDEPTAVLTPQETDELLAIMRDLASSGTSIVFISHKLREVKAVSDVITVIRRGQVVGDAEPTAEQSELAAMMVGHDVSLKVDKAPAEPGEATFSIRDLVVADRSGQRPVDGISLDISKGEILAVAGVQGNGQTELAEAIMGLTNAHVTGSIKLEGRELLGRTPHDVLHAGVGFVPEDRTEDGLVGSFTIAENLVLDVYGTPKFSTAGSMKMGAIAKNATELVDEFDIRAQSIQSLASQLSGGNQQKVVMARELSRPLSLFVASQPTRGVDVGSIEFLHERIVAERDKDTPVLIVSTELDEVYALADRIAVLFDGKVMGIVEPDTPRDVLGLMMAGSTLQEALDAAADVEPGPVAAAAPDEGPEETATVITSDAIELNESELPADPEGTEK
ncbi:ABC transporter ATP-binding protein [Galactobacter sp.]|uniref:ABC transporter ATP-binding protein n=1 Tax=Galactobacter sp. TaxID=2676125 RepID=UPI0025BB11B7|nr:ABC transporter ATP-binding protein [Galactobacter sp.]